MIINHNMSAINANNVMSRNQSQTAKTLEKLSSGLRINRAADDAAGLSISEKMRAQIRGLDQAVRNSNEGINLIQTAEGALGEVHEMIKNMRDKLVQAANDTNTADDRTALQDFVDAISSEVNRVGNTTEYNTMKLLNGGIKTDSSGKAIGSTVTTDGKSELVPDFDNFTISSANATGKEAGSISMTVKTTGTEANDDRSATWTLSIDKVFQDRTDSFKFNFINSTNATITVTVSFGSAVSNLVNTSADGTLVLTSASLTSATQLAGDLASALNGKLGGGLTASSNGYKVLMGVSSSTATSSDVLSNIGITGAGTLGNTDTESRSVGVGGFKELSLTEVAKTGNYFNLSIDGKTVNVKVVDGTGDNDDAMIEKGTAIKYKDTMTTDEQLKALADAVNVQLKDSGSNIYGANYSVKYTSATGTVNSKITFKNEDLSGKDADINVTVGAYEKFLETENEIKGTPNTKVSGLYDTAQSSFFLKFDGGELTENDTIKLSIDDGTGNQKTLEIAFSANTSGSYDDGKIVLNKNLVQTNVTTYSTGAIASAIMTQLEKLSVTGSGTYKISYSDEEFIKFEVASSATATVQSGNYSVTKDNGAKGSLDLKLDTQITRAAVAGSEFKFTIGGQDFKIDVVEEGELTEAQKKDGTAIAASDLTTQKQALVDALKIQLDDNTSIKYSVKVLTANDTLPATGTVGDIRFTNEDSAFKDAEVALSLKTFEAPDDDSTSGVYVAKLQIGANTNQSLTVEIKDMRANALGITSTSGGAELKSQDGSVTAKTRTVSTVTDGTNNKKTEFSLDVSSHENATKAVTIMNDALTMVSKERSKLGALQNRLEHTINNLSTTSENLTSAESGIRDTNMAKEMMSFTKLNILNQASQSMLSQANQLPQGVLSLLR